MSIPATSKLKVRMGDKELELEGEPEHVAKVIAQLLALESRGSLVTIPGGEGDSPSQSGTPPTIVDIRSFFGDHRPEL